MKEEIKKVMEAVNEVFQEYEGTPPCHAVKTAILKKTENLEIPELAVGQLWQDYDGTDAVLLILAVGKYFVFYQEQRGDFSEGTRMIGSWVHIAFQENARVYVGMHPDYE